MRHDDFRYGTTCGFYRYCQPPLVPSDGNLLCESRPDADNLYKNTHYPRTWCGPWSLTSPDPQVPPGVVFQQSRPLVPYSPKARGNISASGITCHVQLPPRVSSFYQIRSLKISVYKYNRRVRIPLLHPTILCICQGENPKIQNHQYSSLYGALNQYYPPLTRIQCTALKTRRRPSS